MDSGESCVGERRPAEVVAWHPLEHHCADVAAVMEALLQIRNIRHRLARLAGKDDLTAREIARLCVLTALHDLGKANLGFQAKGVPELGTAAGHVGEALALLFRGSAEYREPLQLSALQHWGDATGELLAASVSHHGRPLGENLPPFHHSWWRARGGRDPKERARVLGARSARLVSARVPERGTVARFYTLPTRVRRFGHAC